MGKIDKESRNKLALLGNALIFLSLLGFLAIFSPIIIEEINYRIHPFSVLSQSTDFSINIPGIGISAPVIANVDPWNKPQYLAALKNGVAQAKNTSLPDQKGLTYLFAHSSDLPWRITRYNTAFFRLGRIKIGEQILLTYRGKDYRYSVREKKTVWPSEVQYLVNDKRDQLILQTCTPLGTSLKRLLVFADPE